ncbi:TonB family protein [bacterium]|nr:TonB family protein [bacterium]
MNKSQKSILIIEAILLIVGLGIYFLIPEKTIDLSDLQFRFEESIQQYNKIQSVDYSIVATRVLLLDKRSDEIEDLFNDKKATYEELSSLISMFEREIKDILGLNELYERGLKQLQETKGRLNKWVIVNQDTIDSSASISSEVDTVQKFFKSVEAKFVSANSEEEVKYAVEKMAEIKGKISYFNTLVRDQEKRDADKRKSNAAYQKKLDERKRQEALARKKAEELKKKQEEADAKALKDQKEESVGKTSSARLTFRAIPEYPIRMREMGFGGQVKIKVTVGTDGKPKNIKILRSSGNDTLDFNAEKAAEKCVFAPAYQNGKPIEEDFIIPYDFSPDE